MGSLVLEQPGQVGLDVDATLLGGTHDAEENGPTMGPGNAAGKQRRMPQLRVPLELAFGLVVVQGQVGFVDESGQAGPVLEHVSGYLADWV